MVDQMVLQTQQWLNNTYGNDSRFNRVEENGQTGWATIYALTRALQIELGIQATADNFGPTSRELYGRDPLRPGNTNSNKNSILQGALWCKGYNAGHSTLDGIFDEYVAEGVRQLKEDAGLVNPDAIVTTNFMAALLSMMQFKLIPGTNGDSNIRIFQQYINRNFEVYCGIIPCDGIYDRNTNSASIYMLQALEGLPISVANGVFGPTTQACCPTVPYSNQQTDYFGHTYSEDEIEQFTYLLNVCLYVNGFGSGNFDSIYRTELVSGFQRLSALQSNGVANLSTWMSLLISSGDPTRPAAGCDTRFQMTEDRLSLLKEHGYLYIGRYVTHADIQGEDKALQLGELDRIVSRGFGVFPIAQSSGDECTYFTRSQGVADTIQAEHDAAYEGIPRGATIYYAVDFDALDAEVTTNILPYFQGIHETAKYYKVGVYGARNICTRVSEAGYATSSFVSDMSTGYSGNMGYRLPENWMYDQFANITISNAKVSLEIDKVAVRNPISVNQANKVPIGYIIPQEEGIRWQYRAKVNTSNVSVPLHDVSGNVVYEIPSGDMYIQANQSDPSVGPTSRTYRVITVINGAPTQLWITETKADGGTGGEFDYPWVSEQFDFMRYNDTDNGLIPATVEHIIVNDTGIQQIADCSIFTIQHEAIVNLVDSGTSTLSTAILNAGTKIALASPTVGLTRPLFHRMFAVNSNGSWHILQGYQGTYAEEMYIDLGFQYGASPTNRTLR